MMAAMIHPVIPGRVQREPGIHFSSFACGPMDSGVAASRRLGMTEEIAS
jgi:hypothetical protein